MKMGKVPTKARAKLPKYKTCNINVTSRTVHW